MVVIGHDYKVLSVPNGHTQFGGLNRGWPVGGVMLSVDTGAHPQGRPEGGLAETHAHSPSSLYTTA